MEMLPGEFLKSIAVGSEHLYSSVHTIYFFPVLPDLLFLI